MPLATSVPIGHSELMLPIKTILCPTDFSEPSAAALNDACELALHFGAALCLVHVVPIVPVLPPDPGYYVFDIAQYQRVLHADAEQKLRQLAEQVATKGLRSRTTIGQGEAAGEIVLAAEREKADMIVIATHGFTGWRHLFLGSVTEKVVRQAKCPVLTIRAAR